MAEDTPSPFKRNIKREENIFELVPAFSMHGSITKPMIVGAGPKDIPESALAMGIAYISKPEVLGAPTHVHPFDQWIYLIGADVFTEFDADAEFTLGDEVFQINYPCYIFVPKNVKHCPLDIKRVGKPIYFIDASITQEASVRPETVASTERPQYMQVDKEKK